MTRNHHRSTGRNRLEPRSAERRRDPRRLSVEHLENRNMLSASGGIDSPAEQGGFVAVDNHALSITNQYVIVHGQDEGAGSVLLNGGEIDLGATQPTTGDPFDATDLDSPEAFDDRLQIPPVAIAIYVPLKENEPADEGGFVVIPPPPSSAPAVENVAAKLVVDKLRRREASPQSATDDEALLHGLAVESLDHEQWKPGDAGTETTVRSLQGGVGRSQAFVLAAVNDVQQDRPPVNADSSSAEHPPQSSSPSTSAAGPQNENEISRSNDPPQPALLWATEQKLAGESSAAGSVDSPFAAPLPTLPVAAVDRIHRAAGKAWNVHHHRGESAALHDTALADLLVSSAKAAAEHLAAAARHPSGQLVIVSFAGGMLADIARRKSQRPGHDDEAATQRLPQPR